MKSKKLIFEKGKRRIRVVVPYSLFEFTIGADKATLSRFVLTPF